jgi:hypothetical protein
MVLFVISLDYADFIERRFDMLPDSGVAVVAFASVSKKQPITAKEQRAVRCSFVH